MEVCSCEVSSSWSHPCWFQEATEVHCCWPADKLWCEERHRAQHRTDYSPFTKSVRSTSPLTHGRSSLSLLLKQCDIGKKLTKQSVCVWSHAYTLSLCGWLCACVFVCVTPGWHTHLSSCVHVGAMLDELGHHFHMALLRGQMESVQSVLEGEKREWASIYRPSFK